MFCVNCGAKLERSWGHCSNCGAKTQTSETVSLKSPAPNLKSQPKFKFGCGSVVLILIAAGFISSLSSSRELSNPLPSESVSSSDRQELSLEEAIQKTMGASATIQELASVNCFLFEDYSTDFFMRLAEEIPAALPNYKKVKEPRKALAFIQDNDLTSANFLSDYQKAFNRGVNATLKVVEDKIDFTIYAKGPENWNDIMGLAILSECESLRGRSCEYSSAYCWNVDVVSKASCSYLYLEFNVIDSSGAIVDYTNDAARNVGAGQVVKLSLTTFNDSASTGEITQLSCQ